MVSHTWIEPQDPRTPAYYWLTRRSADAAPGYDLGLPDLRICRKWNGRDAWISHEQMGKQRMEAVLVCLHGNNGWRIEGAATVEDIVAAVARQAMDKAVGGMFAEVA